MSSEALATLDTARARRAAVIRWLRPLAPLVMAVVVWSVGTSQPGRPAVVVLGLFIAAGIGAVATLTRRPKVHLACTGAILATSAALTWLAPDSAAVAGIFVGVSFLAPLLRGHVSIPIAVVALILLAVAVASAHNGGSLVESLLDALMVGAFYGMLVFAIRLAEANEEAEQLVEELARGRAAQAEAARLAERQRLAREMHDVLAHSLTGLMLQLEGARMLAVRTPGDPRLPAALERAQQLGRAGLDEARRAIGLLRDDELPDLAELTRSFARDHGVRCELTTEGAERELESPARMAVYRVAQEALTNAAKHAEPTLITVRLQYEAETVRLTVEDFGVRPAVVSAGAGYGLTGMRERAELLGGTLETTPTDKGFRVTLEVPA
ncbi:sensor histidine kinase [Dactylosporangium vinaceum]|uniref:histidine kinase n=1 Tax=Dactylosporangium vinaceum TaxID=53362 RepID=A0ABV5M0S4_9ACTN|nr:sensor histidine kinase [Dactylosporangium vinaceum]UAB97279.1 sensor histidine kinase [Dactylosporangium vinaceum]